MPAPNTTGGALMGYPASVDNGLILPEALYDGEVAAGVSTAPVATTAYLVAVKLTAPATLTGIRVRFGVGGTGHYDVGIYDATGANGAPNNLLAHAAAVASSLITSTATLTPALIGGNLVLSPGNYWLAVWCENAADTIFRVTAGNNMAPVQSGTTAGPLPALASSLTALGNSNFKPIIVGLLLGGWS
jgi:hypothetical protein